jgi:hypothetical protein
LREARPDIVHAHDIFAIEIGYLDC